MKCKYINILVKEMFNTIYNRKNIDLPRMQSIHRLEDEYSDSNNNIKQSNRISTTTSKGKDLENLIKSEIEYVKNLSIFFILNYYFRVIKYNIC